MAIEAAHLKVAVSADTRDAESGLERVNSKIGTFGKVAAMAATGGVVALAAGIGGAVKVAADFQQSLANVGAATGATSEQMAAMRKEALSIGADTSKGAGEAVEAMGELTKSGISVQDVVGGVGRTVVQLSEATGSSVSSMATLMSDSLNVFKIDAADAGYAANILAQAAGASSIDINDMAQSLASGGLVAKNAGLSIDDFATAIGIMGNQGLKGSDAGTSLKSVIAGLTPTSKDAKKAFANLGIEVFDSAGKFKAFPDILASLSTAFSGLTEEQRASTAELLFGSDGIRAFNALVPDTSKGLADATTQFDSFQTAMAGAPSVAEQSKARLATLGGTIETLKGTLETIAITVGSAFLPIITSAVAWLGERLPGAFAAVQAKAAEVLPVLQGFGRQVLSVLVPALQTIASFIMDKVVPALRDFIGGDVLPKVQAFGATLTEKLLPAFKEVAQIAVDVLEPALKKTVGFLADHKEILAGVAIVIGGALVVSFTAWAVAAGAAAVATIAAAAPVIAIGAAIALLAAGIIYLVKHWDDITQRFPILGTISDTVHQALSTLAGFVTDTLIPALGKVIDFFRDPPDAGEVLAFFRELPGKILDGLGDLAALGLKKGRELLTGLWDGAKEVWNDAVSWLAERGPMAVTAIGDLIPTLPAKGRDLIDGLLTGAKEKALDVAAWLIQRGPDAVAAVGDLLGTLHDAGKALLTGLFDGAMFVWDAEVRFFTDIPSAVQRAIGSLIDVLHDHGMDVIKGLFNGAKAVLLVEMALFTNLQGEIARAVGDLSSLLYSAGVQIIAGLLRGLKDKVGDVYDFVGGIAGKIADIKGPIEDDAVLLVPHGMAIMGGLRTGVQRGWNEYVKPYLEQVAPQVADVTTRVMVSGWEKAAAAVRVAVVPAAADLGNAIGEAEAAAYAEWVAVIRAEHQQVVADFNAVQAMAAAAAQASANLRALATTPAGQWPGEKGAAGASGGATPAGGGADIWKAAEWQNFATAAGIMAAGGGRGGFWYGQGVGSNVPQVGDGRDSSSLAIVAERQDETNELLRVIAELLGVSVEQLKAMGFGGDRRMGQLIEGRTAAVLR